MLTEVNELTSGNMEHVLYTAVRGGSEDVGDLAEWTTSVLMALRSCVTLCRFCWGTDLNMSPLRSALQSCFDDNKSSSFCFSG